MTEKKVKDPRFPAWHQRNKAEESPKVEEAKPKTPKK